MFGDDRDDENSNNLKSGSGSMQGDVGNQSVDIDFVSGEASDDANNAAVLGAGEGGDDELDAQFAVSAGHGPVQNALDEESQNEGLDDGLASVNNEVGESERLSLLDNDATGQGADAELDENTLGDSDNKAETPKNDGEEKAEKTNLQKVKNVLKKAKKLYDHPKAKFFPPIAVIKFVVFVGKRVGGLMFNKVLPVLWRGMISYTSPIIAGKRLLDMLKIGDFKIHDDLQVNAASKKLGIDFASSTGKRDNKDQVIIENGMLKYKDVNSLRDYLVTKDKENSPRKDDKVVGKLLELEKKGIINFADGDVKIEGDHIIIYIDSSRENAQSELKEILDSMGIKDDRITKTALSRLQGAGSVSRHSPINRAEKLAPETPFQEPKGNEMVPKEVAISGGGIESKLGSEVTNGLKAGSVSVTDSTSDTLKPDSVPNANHNTTKDISPGK